MTGARANQRLRTRKDLLEAANRLLRDGANPTFEEIAEAAMVSRATAYRYFPGLDALLREAALDVETPTPEDLFGDDRSVDVLARLQRLDGALAGLVRSNAPAMRALLAQSLQPAASDAPVRQNRRSPLIAAALTPVKDQFDPKAFDLLSKALAVLLGIEAEVVFADVLRIAPADADRVRRWMIQALVEAARRD
ncbi:MAG: TetR family transcriptional regulator [Phenylobacterium sp.]|uniref:TetR/AcrR family transcriptional regulator n=1 Tax=Phenylobacterium sp. TaxID=1871053 RepID=UPI0025EA751F|nr:TetR/AcrR family transcriptional regulator [Phenylobacterium sp.]MBI1197677.1 TetR family transcriptional regulator [Phenylobacterium sp.]